jgi:hypothetical protein
MAASCCSAQFCGSSSHRAFHLSAHVTNEPLKKMQGVGGGSQSSSPVKLTDQMPDCGSDGVQLICLDTVPLTQIFQDFPLHMVFHASLVGARRQPGAILDKRTEILAPIVSVGLAAGLWFSGAPAYAGGGQRLPPIDRGAEATEQTGFKKA